MTENNAVLNIDEVDNIKEIDIEYVRNDECVSEGREEKKTKKGKRGRKKKVINNLINDGYDDNYYTDENNDEIDEAVAVVADEHDEYEYEDEDADENDDEALPDEIVDDIPEEDKETLDSEGIANEFIKIMEDYHSDDKKKNESSRERACTLMQNFVYSIIHKHYKTYIRQYWEDLCQAGFIGVLTAMEKYDPKIGRPSTYFYRHIIHEIQAFIDKEINKMTPHYSANMRKIDRTIASFEADGIPYTQVDIAIQTKLSVETVSKVLGMKHSSDEIHSDSMPVSCLEGRMEKADVLTPEQEIIKREQSETLHRAINNLLDNDEKIVLIYTMGLYEQNRLSNKAIAEKLSIPIDKVRKLYSSSLRKLRSSNLKHFIKDYLEDDNYLVKAADINVVPEKKNIARYIRDLEDVEIDF